MQYGELVKNEEPEEEGSPADCASHWPILLLSALYIGALLALRNKDKKIKLGALAADVALAAGLTVMGDCPYDKFFLIGNVLMAVPALNIVKSDDGEGVLDIDNSVVKKATLAAAALGTVALLASTATLLASSVLSDDSEDVRLAEVQTNDVAKAEDTTEPIAEVVTEKVVTIDIDDEAETSDETVTAPEEETTEDLGEAADAATTKYDTVEPEQPAIAEPEEINPAEGEDSAITPEDESEEVSTISVEAGMDSRSIANLLEEAGVIESAKEFDNFLCAEGYDRKLKIGSFDIPSGADEATIANILIGK